MIKYFMIIVLFFLSSCGRNEGDQTLHELRVWMDRGIQCSSEVEQSTFNLNLVPVGAEKDIAAYLDREYGAPRFSDPIEIGKIAYTGKYSACGKMIKIWEYPCREVNGCYVGIQPWINSYITGTIHPEFEL